MKISFLPLLTPLVAFLIPINEAQSAELLAVDFGSAPSGVEPGFVGQTAFTQTHSTTAGDITVSFAGQQGFFVYAGGGTNPALFDDFVFDNSGPMTMTLSGPGVGVSTEYTLTVWSYYGVQARDTTVTGISGTTGTTLGPIAFVNPPTSLDDNSATGNFTSDGSGNLTFSLGAGRPAINGFRLTVGGADTTAPTLTGSDIVDDQSGGPAIQGAPVTYTVSFSEDMDATTVEAADFGNAGTATFTIGTITEPSPGIFSVPVTPTSTGTLQLQVNQSAVLNDAAGNPLDTSSAIIDDTSITVDPPDTTNPTLASADIADDQGGGPVASSTLVTYTITFSEDMDHTSMEAADFGNAGTSSITIGTITETSPGVFTVQVTPTTAGTLQLQVNQSAVLTDTSGNPLDTSAPITDDSSITVNTGGGGDTTPPTLASGDMVDDQSGGPVGINSLVTYTVTFSEDMDSGTVGAGDFDNAGTSTIAIGTISETAPGVFTVEITPTDAGTLQLRIPAGATLDDAAGNPLNTSTAILDDTTLSVAPSSTTTLLAVDFGAAGVEPGFVGQSSSNVTHSTPAGNLTVDLANTQSLFNFGTSGANDLLYRDFYFKNGGAMTLTLSGIAISPNTDYELSFWSYYGAEARNTTFAPAGTTSGPSLGPIATSTTAPSGLADPLYTIAGTYTSDASGVLAITVAGTGGRPALNAVAIATIGPDTTPPSLLPGNIVDDQGGGTINENTLVTYTVTFSEDIDASSVDATDFSNAGTSPISFGAVTEATPGVFTVEVTPTAAGSLQLQVPIGATILDTAGLAMDTSTATIDDTTITVVVAPPDTTPPTPNPMSFAAAPYATSETSIAMEATAASDLAGVEYYFTETSGNPGGDDSGWQGSPTYEDTGLTTGLVYTYTVTARDLSSNQNPTTPSDPESATAQTPVVPPAITAPTSRHIVQRSATDVGTIEIEGTYSVGVPDSVEARAVVMSGAGNNGTTTAWQTIDAAPAGGTFSGDLTGVPAGGWYQLEVRTVLGGSPSNAAVLEKVGVGDIFVTAGQSNSANFASNQPPQDDRISARTSTTDSTWTLATAPLPISNGGGGSVWTWFANRLIAATDLPVGIVSCGIGGSPASSWTPGGGNYNNLLKPAVQSFPVNGFRAGLWHQGETDSIQGVTAVTHAGYLTGMVSQSRIDAGWSIPWYLAEASFHPSSNIAAQEPIAAGQRMAILGDALTFFGPSTDELHLTGGGSLHFNAVGVDDHARQWAEILLGTTPFGLINGNFETHGWIQYAAPNDTSATPLADGASRILDTITTGQQHRVLHWRILSAGSQTAADGSNGFHNPTTGTYAGAVDTVNGGVLTNMAGNHVALLDGGTAGNYFLQSTRSNAEPNTTYTLTVALGVRDNPASFGTARLELTSNGVVVASTSFDKAALDTLRGSDSSGTFTDASISWTTGGTVTANQPLAVRIVKEGGAGTVLDFDNVRLFATPTNDFNSWIGGFGLPLADQDFDDDPDGDGLANGLEAWLGTHPGQFNEGLSDFTTDGTTTTFTHPMNASPPVDVTGGYYDWCENLKDWHPSGSGPSGGPTVTFVAVTAGTTTTVTATASEPLDRLFFRLGASQN